MNQRAARSRIRSAVYVLIALLIPPILLLALEGSLRMLGYGDDHPLFVPAEEIPGYLKPNPHIIRRYFTSAGSAPRVSPDTHYFRATKPEDGVRIVIMGGSTAAGFPLGRFASLSGMLSQRFKRLYPNTDFELVSVAMSAVNSYALLDFADEVLEVRPDLVLIYAGHNEFLGVMGVASTYLGGTSRWPKLALLRLNELRIFQLLRATLRFGSSEHPSSSEATLMARVARGGEIPLDSPMFVAGADQFSLNLARILEMFASEDVPVVLGTLVSNERDQYPLADENKDPRANLAFTQAKRLEHEQQFSQASHAYQQARDLDSLRFRAPARFNEIIRSEAERAGVYIADVESVFREHSAHGIIGASLIYEHLHPNPRGYFLMAEAFVEAIERNGLVSEPAQVFPARAAWREVPLTEVDVRLGQLKVEQILSGFPFRRDDSVRGASSAHPDPLIEQLAHERMQGAAWLQVQQSLLAHYQQQARYFDAARVAAMLFDAFPTEHTAAFAASELYFAAGDPSLSFYHAERAHRLLPTDARYLMAAARALNALGRTQEAIDRIRRVLEIDPGHRQANVQLKRLEAS